MSIFVATRRRRAATVTVDYCVGIVWRMRDLEDNEIHEFAMGQWGQLQRIAFLMCGDWHRAEDLVQTTLAKVLVAGRRTKIDNLGAYARTTLTRAFLDERRTMWWQRERPRAEVADGAPVEVSTPGPDIGLREQVLAALARLPPKCRAVMVLRYWDDRSIEETAAMLRITTGTVKSQSARGLAALRAILAEQEPELGDKVTRRTCRRE